MKLIGKSVCTNHVYDTGPYDQQREHDLGMLLFTILASVLGSKIIIIQPKRMDKPTRRTIKAEDFGIQYFPTFQTSENLISEILCGPNYLLECEIYCSIPDFSEESTPV